MTEINFNEGLLRRIVRAIDKAIADDVPRISGELQLETMNNLRMMRSDCINENLRALAMNEDVDFIKFTRYSWQGRMLVDHKNHVTYSITTQQTLQAIPKKKERRVPHFLMSMLAVENGDLKGQYEQLTLFPIDQFDRDEYEKDYVSIMNGALDPKSGYRHYVIAYDFDYNRLTSVDIVFLDKDFRTIAEKSLNEFIRPDFARLTDNEVVASANSNTDTSDGKKLVALKPGIKPQLYAQDDEA